MPPFLRTSFIAVCVVGMSGASMGEQISKREYPGVQNFSRVDATTACGGALGRPQPQ